VIHVNRLPTLVRQHIAAFRALLVFTVLCGIIYPVVMVGVAQVAFKNQADGSLVTYNGKVVGSSLLCQEFVDAKGNPLPQYFQPRPSTASSSSVKNDYGCDPNYSGAANLGPNNTTLLKTVQQLQQQIAAFDHVKVSQIPPDAVTSSGSGLDPDISPQYAAIQTPRVASARHLPVSQVQALVSKYTQGRNIGFLGEPRVNVLNLNIALDELPGQAQYAQAGA
jgi:potassium-transporting ATPase KdpC subunit